MNDINAVQEDALTIKISDRGGSRVERGHLWIFSNEIINGPTDVELGTFCKFTSSGRTIGVGYYNPHSLIAGRVLAREDVADIDALIEYRLKRAFAQRAPLEEGEAARLVFSESDFLPGVIIDVYGSTATIQVNTAGADRLLPYIESRLPELFKEAFGRALTAIVIRADSPFRKLESIDTSVRVALGDDAAVRDVKFTEGGVTFSADLIEGQKTGFFLDQRDNRDHIAWRLEGAKTARVLDLFCYSGAWGLRALKSGIEHATFVDESAPALALVEKGMALNGFSEARGRRINRNAFDFLQNDNDRYDVVVADPPAFAKSKKDVPAALRAYEKLARQSWRRVKPGGLLVICSCSYQVSEEEFEQAVASAVAKEKGLAQVAHRGAQASDHPVLLSMPETRYLKCLVLKKVPR